MNLCKTTAAFNALANKLAYPPILLPLLNATVANFQLTNINATLMRYSKSHALVTVSP
jgi:hypothetical protein